MYKKLKEPVHKWPKVLAMKDCAIKCIDAATNECPVSCPLSSPFSPPSSLLRPPLGLPWDPVALSCKLILWPDCRIDNENENEDYLPNGVNSLLNNIALTCQQQKYLVFFACVATDLLACPAHTQRREQLWQQFAVQTLQFDCIRIINYIPQSEMYN